MTKSIYVTKKGGPNVLTVREENPPKATGSNVVVRAHYCGVNYADVMSRAGLDPDTPKLPFIPGFEASGEVVETGNQVTGLQAGDRVIAVPMFGGAFSRLFK